IQEEVRIKNVHNIIQDSIITNGQNVEQKQSIDTISALTSATSQPAIAAWDTFVSSTSRSTGNPLNDIGLATINIEGTGVGGRVTRIGMHQLTLAALLANSNIRGIAPTTPDIYDIEPGTGSMHGVEG